MSKLVLLSEGFTGKTYELKVDKTTVGRLDDNAFQIADRRCPATTARFSVGRTR